MTRLENCIRPLEEYLELRYISGTGDKPFGGIRRKDSLCFVYPERPIWEWSPIPLIDWLCWMTKASWLTEPLQWTFQPNFKDEGGRKRERGWVCSGFFFALAIPLMPSRFPWIWQIIHLPKDPRTRHLHEIREKNNVTDGWENSLSPS